MPTELSSDEVRERDEARRRRLRQELADEGFPLPVDAITDLVVEELTYARYVQVHEGIFPNYGALVGDSGAVPEGATTKSGETPLDMRKFVDGNSSFIVRRADDAESVILVHYPIVDELDAVDLCAETSSTYVQRLESGALTVTTAERILIGEGFTWRARPVARTRTHGLNDVLQLSTLGNRLLFGRLLDFAFHQLSPRHIGATIVIDMTGDTTGLTAALGAPGNNPPFDLNLAHEVDARAMVAYLRVVDGACLVASDGRVMRAEAKLQSNDVTTALIRPEGGMRHSSAKWFSFEHPEVVVIVVSADGPVSLYSDGAKIAVFDEDPQSMISALEIAVDQRGDLSRRLYEFDCETCGKTLRVDGLSHPSFDRPQTLACPICRSAVGERTVTQFRIYPSKPWFRPIAETSVD